MKNDDDATTAMMIVAQTMILYTAKTSFIDRELAVIEPI
jgi:hypothetical protein